MAAAERWVRLDDDDTPGTAECWADLESARVDVGDGLFLPAQTEVRTRVGNHNVVVQIGVSDGRLVATEFLMSQQVSDPPLTYQTLRDVPVSQLVKHAGRAIQRHASGFGSAWPTPEELQHVADRGPDDMSLQVIARVYRVAYLVGDAPTKRVETLFNLPRSTAGRWVALARQRGFLSAAAGPGKAGG